MRVKKNNEWLNMSEEFQWMKNNEWHRHSSANYPNYYVLNPNDWMMTGYGILQYVGDGTDSYIVIPETNATGDIPTVSVIIPRGLPIQGIATGSAELALTDYLFYSYFASGEQNTIELDYFFTPEVLYMEGMFEESEYEYLDLRSFDTKKCYSFAYMFSGTRNLKTLDISSFDISATDDAAGIFSYSSVETVYVKNQQIADYLDLEGGKAGINFVIGSST